MGGKIPTQSFCVGISVSEPDVAVRSHEIQGILLEPGAPHLRFPGEHVERKA
jgi:hypothetical protein